MRTTKPHHRCSDFIQNPENNTVEVYLRFTNSKSLKIKLPTYNSVHQIRTKIHELTNVDIQNQILFYNGKELVDGKEVKLKEKAIIHIKNKKENIDNIIVHVIKHNPQERNIFKLNFQYTAVHTDPQTTIEQLLQNLIDQHQEDIDYKRTKVIECGRFLKLHKTLSQQKIQSYTQIHLIVRRKLKQSQLQNDKEQKLLIESVLKRSFDYQMMARESKTDRIMARLDQQYEQEKQEGQPSRNSQITYRQEQAYEIRRSLPNYFSATKASELWQSQKYIRKELTPLKFSFREYKKYDGPKSVRDCNCKRKMQFYEQPCEHMMQSQARESPKNSGSPKDSVLKSTKKIKTSMSMFF